jgi:hypothetical protein
MHNFKYSTEKPDNFGGFRYFDLIKKLRERIYLEFLHLTMPDHIR